MILPYFKKGSALVISVFFVFCMFIMLGAMVFRQTSTSSHNQISLLERQAFFASRSAMQHFLLKAKLFPTELYDAVEISQGKNPMFNFTEFPKEDDYGNEFFEEYIGRPNLYIKIKTEENKYSDFTPDGKPRYFYIKLPSKDSFIRVASYNNPDYRFLAKGIAQPMQDKKYTEPVNISNNNWNELKYLTYYYRDCRNYSESGANLQPLLEVKKSNQITNINKFDIATDDEYPYTMRYYVSGIKVKAIQGMRKYGEEAIEIEVVGEVVNFKKQNCSQTHVRTQKITRKDGSIDD